MAKKIWEAGGTVHAWDPDMTRKLTPEDRKQVVLHERGHLELSRARMSPEAYEKVLEELKRLGEGTWP